MARFAVPPYTPRIGSHPGASSGPVVCPPKPKSRPLSSRGRALLAFSDRRFDVSPAPRTWNERMTDFALGPYPADARLPIILPSSAPEEMSAEPHETVGNSGTEPPRAIRRRDKGYDDRS